MAQLKSLTFTGIPTSHGRVAGPILAADFATVAADQALIKEDIEDGHDHNEAGNLLPWPVASWCGGPARPDLVDWATLTNNYQEPGYVYAVGAASTFDVFTWPVRIPDGWANRVFLVVLHYSSRENDDVPNCRVTVCDNAGTPYVNDGTVYSTFTATTGNYRKEFSGFASSSYGGMVSRSPENARRRLYVSPFTVDTADIYVGKVELTALADTGHTFHGLTIVPFVNGAALARADLPARPIPPADAPRVNVGDPDAATANTYIPVDETLCAADFPLGPAVMLGNLNGSYLEERGTGLPATGNATVTVGGHRHSGKTAAPYDKKIVDMVLWSCPFGTIQATSASLAIADRIRAPRVAGSTTTDYRTARTGLLRIPANESGTTTVYAAPLIYFDAGAKGSQSASVRITLGGGVANEYTKATSTDGYYLLTNSTPLPRLTDGSSTVPSAETCVYSIEIKTAQDDASVVLMGVLFWCE